MSQLLFLQNTKNLVISRCCFAEDGKEMHQDSKRTYTAIVLFVKPFVWCRYRHRRRRGLLKLPIVRWETRHAFYVIGLKNIRIHLSTRYRIRCGYIFFHFGERIYFFPDLQCGFAVEFAGYVWTVAVSGTKKLRIRKYPDTCGRGLRLTKRKAGLILGISYFLSCCNLKHF